MLHGSRRLAGHLERGTRSWGRAGFGWAPADCCPKLKAVTAVILAAGVRKFQAGKMAGEAVNACGRLADIRLGINMRAIGLRLLPAQPH